MRHSVLITGASTGIGREATRHLIARGHQIFASVRREADAAELAREGAVPLLFDVTDHAAIEAALAVVEARRDPALPFSLVNNAGIAVAGPVECVTIDEWRKQFEVNVIGLVKATQVFLPVIRATGGRIVNMSSVSGLAAAPFLGPYAASKFAVEALSDSLRREVEAQGVKVILIEPGPIATPIWQKGLGADFPKTLPLYDAAVARFTNYVEQISQAAVPASRVSVAIERALNDRRPALRMIVASLATRVQHEVQTRLPARLIDRVIVKSLFR